MLDCYDNMICTDYSVAVTTRFNACNHYFYVEIYEYIENTL